MALIEVFSKLHSMISMSPKYRLGFLLTDSGLLLNFQGSKKWLEIDENVVLQVITKLNKVSINIIIILYISSECGICFMPGYNHTKLGIQSTECSVHACVEATQGENFNKSFL